ncbi:RAMP superfamily CRISPR-associated protein [Desulfonema magnum]|uniref:CRISPR type III-associated RAMP domain-containing protein n=1 Tax=Desulfonema magnum TaxID=45655 RepID=A0A975GSG7_9BACT|nr:RAMP superfamily CRISPR-associated protein [Desulfonema magnum]QTA92051.1 CRISPR type III-associated RAMP domain-containing protein [Desulfonema magnum]
MPQNENFWNPYRMIPVRERIEKKPPLTDEKFKGKSGVISCSLENLTPLFIGGNRNFGENFLTRDGKCVIPGSSLKGMLRSLAEIVGGGCFVVADRKVKHDSRYKACDNANSLCVACRMFGMMERGRNARVHRGNISIGDALMREENPKAKAYDVLLSSCGTRHEPFYRSPQTGNVDGKSRKLYFHQPNRTDSVPNVPDKLRSRAWKIRALQPGHHFDFEVQFSNLRSEEIRLLLYVLALEEEVSVTLGEEQIRLRGPLRHKLGNAKPLGMGSCHISVEKLVYLAAPRARFASLREPEDTVYEGDALINELSGMRRGFIGDTSPTMQQLRKMMVWDENDSRSFKYPEYHWFKNPENSRKPLKAI